MKSLRALSFLAALFSQCFVTAKEPVFRKAQCSEGKNEYFVKGLMSKYHLNTAESPFRYEFPTEIYNNLLPRSVAVPQEIEDMAKKLHAHLNQSLFYKDISILKDPLKVRRYQLKETPGTKKTGTLIEAKTSDDHIIRGTLLNRQSDVLVVVGAGFTNYREQMAPFGDMLDSYDILFFDYRGHGHESSHPLRPHSWKSLSKRILGFDRKHVTLGQHEYLDIKTITEAALQQKKYRRVVGLGICYSGLNIVKTAALYPHLFDQLILDGCWFSLQNAAEILARDPGKLAKPQVDSPLADNWLVNKRWFQRFILSCAERLFNIELSTVSILDYAPKLSTNLEILMIQGKKDLLIPREHFEILWNAIPCRNKTAIITSNQHVWNHLKQKELYKLSCELFIERPYAQFTHLLTTPEALVDYATLSLQRKLG